MRRRKSCFPDCRPVSLSVGEKRFPQDFTRQGNVWTHSSGLNLTSEPVFYPRSSGVEWTPVLTNAGAGSSPQVTDFCSLSLSLECGDSPVIAYSLGARAGIDDFAYEEKPVESEIMLGSVGSRSILPFFNVRTHSDRGVILALGWTGSWRLRAVRDGNNLTVTGEAVPDADFWLEPGEHVRGARVLAMPWEGSADRAHNLLRRHLAAYHIPKDERGEPFPPICCTSWGGMSTKNHLRYLDYIKNHGLKFDCYWIDAGWYGPDRDADEFQDLEVNDWAFFQGDYSVNRVMHPDTLKPVSDAAHGVGMKLLLWYDIYNSVEGVGWYAEHPDFGASKLRFESTVFGGKDIKFINVNNPEAKKYIIDTLTASFIENGVDCYREDPPPIYGGEDTEGRRGVCELKAVENLYDIWDTLLERFPGMMIDNCGGGGSRVDLETISKSYVLWRSDYNCHPGADPIGAQIGNFGLGRWVPLVNGAPPIHPGSDYAFRSGLYGGMSFGLFHPCGFKGEGQIYPSDDYPVEWHRLMLEQYRRTKPLLSGDFHALTGCGASPEEFVAYAFDRPDLGEGVIMAFRRQECESETLTVGLPFLEGEYAFEDFDTGALQTLEVVGGFGYTVRIDAAPGSASVYYKKL